MNTHNINNTEIILINLINLYLDNITKYTKELKQCLEMDNLCDREFLRKNNIPLQGYCEEQKINYAFHGIGCSITTPKIELDFDFDTNCKLNRFDIWRLWCFVSDNTLNNEFNIFLNKDTLEKSFIVLEQQNLIKRDENQFYLNDNG